LLDQGAEGLQSRQNKVLTEQTLKQLEAYRSFVKARKRYVIVDASQPAESIREMAYSAVIDMLERRTARLFKSRL
jgi:thymidylate kinase